MRDAAAAMARSAPPRFNQGDLLYTLNEVVAAATPHGAAIVFHSADIPYLEEAERKVFATRMQHLVAMDSVRWVSNDGDRVIPEITRTAGGGRASERFVFGLDGRAVARAHGMAPSPGSHRPARSPFTLPK